ncbi:MAG: hypothetical protein ACUVQF_04220 [Fervidobacterium sp.]|uniref:hypothetical protein n=1 Tax=Fervidobacterium sp. TaxID=1871331 RepID=UPI00404A5718
MAINKRMVILIIILVVVWAVAILVLIRMNSPKPAAAVSPVPNQTVPASAPASAPQRQQGTTVPSNLSVMEIENQLSKLSDIRIEEDGGKNLFSPYLVKIDASILETNYVEDISSPEFQYHGYMSFNTGKKEIKKLFIRAGGVIKSYDENELIEERYKSIVVKPTILVVLDTQDGKIKVLKYIGS